MSEGLELELALTRAVFGELADKWSAALEAALETADEDPRKSLVQLHKEMGIHKRKFVKLNKRREEIAGEAEEIRKMLIGSDGTPALDAVMQVEDRINKLHDESVQNEKDLVWEFIQSLVCLRKIRKMMEDALPGSSVGIEAQLKRDAGLE